MFYFSRFFFGLRKSPFPYFKINCAKGKPFSKAKPKSILSTLWFKSKNCVLWKSLLLLSQRWFLRVLEGLEPANISGMMINLLGAEVGTQHGLPVGSVGHVCTVVGAQRAKTRPLNHNPLPLPHRRSASSGTWQPSIYHLPPTTCNKPQSRFISHFAGQPPLTEYLSPWTSFSMALGRPAKKVSKRQKLV